MGNSVHDRRNSNELWQTVFYKKDNAMQEFALFPRDDVALMEPKTWHLIMR